VRGDADQIRGQLAQKSRVSDPSTAHCDPLGAQQFSLPPDITRGQPTVGPDYTPPRQVAAPGQEAPHRPGGSRVTGPGCHLAVADHLAIA
jgi:hypothetical protein